MIDVNFYIDLIYINDEKKKLGKRQWSSTIPWESACKLREL